MKRWWCAVSVAVLVATAGTAQAHPGQTLKARDDAYRIRAGHTVHQWTVG
jgi:hypothetical protein